MTGLEALKIIERDCEDLEQVPYGEFALIEKSLKALEIIKEKECDVRWLKFCIKGNAEVETYNSGYPGYRKKLTEEEFDTLKEMLK